MDRLRLLHIADAHLDTPFYGRQEDLRRNLLEACRTSFSRAVDEAINREAHAVLIAGDLFDNELLSFATERFIVEQMHRLTEAGVAVFYATGNHDPGHASYSARRISWPDNVELFAGTTPRTVPIRDKAGRQIAWLTAAGHNTQHEADDIAAKFEPARKDLPHIGLLHTQILSARGAAEHDRYAPSTREDLVRCGFDYWALGHVHLRQRVFEDLPAWYAGNLQGRHPRETGPKGALWLEVAKDHPVEPEFIPLAPIVWETIELPCPPAAQNFEALARVLAEAIRAQAQLDDGAQHFLRVDLIGQSPLSAELADEDNRAELAQTIKTDLDLGWVEMRDRGVTATVDVEAYRDSPTVLGTALELIRQASLDEEMLDSLLAPEGLAVHCADVTERHGYLRGLLEGLEEEAAIRLIPPESR